MLFYKKYYKEDYPKFFDKFDGERKGKQIMYASQRLVFII